jgi:vanillate O-demethylase ferredoxin subunit
MTARIIMKMRVAETREESGDVRVFTLRHPWRNELPYGPPGSHVDVRLPGERIRQYSLCGDPDDRSQYVIAVKREDRGRGGSQWVHEHLVAGAEAHVSAPRNNFPLSAEAGRHVIIAGGIGITPFLAMIHRLKATSADFELHYCSRNETPPFLRDLRQMCGERLHLYLSTDANARRLNPEVLLAGVQPETHVYCCGPQRLTDAVRAAVAHWPHEQVHFEVFQATLDENFKPEPFDVKIASTGQVYRIPADRSALEVLREAGLVLPSSCELGVCGSCECGYRDGVVIHRDAVLSVGARQDRMMLCVSRARVQVTLDL